MKGPRRRKGRRKPAPPRGMCWVLRLEQNEFGDSGYFCLAGPDGITVQKQPGGLMQKVYHRRGCTSHGAVATKDIQD
jgi:hypothetical protein